MRGFSLGRGIGTLLVSPIWKTGAAYFSNANWLCAKALLWVVGTFAEMPGGHVYVEIPRAGGVPECEFTVLDLHEGGAAHLRAGGRDWLLDSGHAKTYPRTVLPYLRSRGINQLDVHLVYSLVAVTPVAQRQDARGTRQLADLGVPFDVVPQGPVFRGRRLVGLRGLAGPKAG